MEENIYIIGFDKQDIHFELYFSKDNNEYILRACDPEFGYESALKQEYIFKVEKMLDDMVLKMIDDINIFKGELK